MHHQQTAYLPAGQVRSRYGISDMALWRWLRNEQMNFPRPLRLNGRRYWKLADLEAWEASRADQRERVEA
jgi:predicted DNA-binding transcriptional regulator AlpA